MKGASPEPRRALLACAHRIWNVPPIYNAARVLGAAGIDTWVIGYQAEGLRAFERLGPRARIVRFALRSRNLRIGTLRKLSATFEFLRAAKHTAERLRPDLLITFNDPASLILPRCPRVPLRVAWALEYPEFEFTGLAERTLLRWSARHWPDADWFVAPTPQRLALHMGLEPRLVAKRAFVVPNTAQASAGTPPAPSVRGEEARRWLETAGRQGWLRVVYAGAVGNRYAIDPLIRAVDAEPRVALLILGKKHALSLREVGDARATCRSGERFLWVDEVPYAEMQSLLSLADVGFAHYLGDTLNTRFSAPGKLYEYLRAGLVLLTDDECCLRAEARAADCGAFFPAPATAGAIRRALGELEARAPELSQMKARAQDLFRNHLSLERQMQPLLEALRHRFESHSSS